jgi:hypothetical protein
MIATESFATEINGEQVVVVVGRTRISADSELYAMFPQYFESVSEGMEYPSAEAATDNPGEGRQRAARARVVKEES